MQKWFLIYCKPRQDVRAEENLTRQGYDVFRPTINIVKKKIGYKNSIKSESLFPRYVFINVDPEIKSISPVLSTYGVACFVKFGENYAIVSENLIDKIKSNADKQIVIENDRSSFKRGEGVYVDGHGFDQVKAIYCNSCGNERAMILMNILGNEFKLSIPIECISKIEN